MAGNPLIGLPPKPVDPWAAYADAPAAAPAQAADPWAAFQDAPAGKWTPPAPPAGEIIHGKTGDYMSDRPDMTAVRPAGQRDQAVEEMALRKRYLNNSDALKGALPFFQGNSLGWGDEVVSGLSALRAGMNGNPVGDNYDITQAAQKQMLDRQKIEHPYASMAGELAGGALTTLAAAPATMAARGMGIGTRLAAGTADATLQGAVAGAGASDPGERLNGALHGAGWGASLGALGNVGAAALGKGAQSVLNALASRGDETLSGISGAARNYATRLFSDPDRLAAMRAELDRLGPHATPADVSPEWQMIARGAAARPGSRDAIVNALTERQSGANQRLGYDLDAALGHPVVPSEIEAGLAANRNVTAEGYGPVMQRAGAVDTQGLADSLDAAAVNLRGPAQQAVNRVRGYLNIPGDDVLDPNPQALMATRQAIDGLLANEANPQVIRHLTVARQQVDGLLADAAPGVKGVDARMQELFRQSEALQQGRPILSNEIGALRPQEVANMVQQGALPAGEFVGPSAVPLRLQQGVRADIDRAVGTQANDVTALRKIVRGEGDWNRQKMGSLFGQDNADAALNAIDREAVFGDTANRVTRGSDTSPGEGFRQALEKMGTPAEIPPNLTWLGMLGYGAKKGVNALQEGAAQRNANRFASELGQTSVATGDARDQLIAALGNRAAIRATPLDPKIQLVLDALAGTRQGAAQELSARRRQ